MANIKFTCTRPAENLSEISQEDLFFAPLAFQDGDDKIIIPQIPRFYLGHVFTSRRTALTFFATHNTAVFLSERAKWLLQYRATCVQQKTKGSTTSSCCNFKTRDVEKVFLHSLLNHKIVHTLGDRAFTSVSECPLAQSATNADKRKNLRDHLFGARLATLCKISRVPVFQKTTNLIERSYTFNDRPFTIIYSQKDTFTAKYLLLLRPLEIRAQFLDFNAVKISDDLFAQFTKFFGSAKATIFNKILQSLSTIVGCMANISILLANPTPFIAQCAITSLAAHVSSFFLPMVLDFLRTPRAQSNFSWVPVAVSFMLMIVLGGKNICASAGMSIFKQAHSLGITLGSIGIFHRLFTEAWKELYPFIHKAIFGTSPSFDECLSQLKEFQELVDDVEAFEGHKKYEQIMTSRHVCDEVVRMNKLLDKLYFEADRARIRPQFTMAVRSIHEKLRAWDKDQKASAHTSCGIRIEPVVFHMCGPSGIGKSLLTALFATEVMKDRITPTPGDSIHNHMYTRNANSQFWSGYSGQEVVVFDDFMQKCDSESNPNDEVFDLIQSANNSPFLVPKAELSEKANSYFISKLIILTTNIEEFKPKSITHPAALRRRVDFMCKVTRGTPKRLPDGKIDTDCYKFNAMKNGKPYLWNLTFDQVVTILREKVAIKQEGCGSLTRSLEERRQAPIIEADLADSTHMRELIQLPAYTEESMVPARSREGVVASAQSGVYDTVLSYVKPALPRYAGYEELIKQDRTEVLRRLRDVVFTPAEIKKVALAEFFLQEHRDLVRLMESGLATDADELFWKTNPPIITAFFDDDKLEAFIDALKANLSPTRLDTIITQIEGPRNKLTEMVTLTYMGYLKQLYRNCSFSSYLSEVFTSIYNFAEWSDFFGALGINTLAVGLLASCVWLCSRSLPKDSPMERIATPEEYAASYRAINKHPNATSELLSEDAYEELYNMKAPWIGAERETVLQKATVGLSESWDIEGKTPRMRGPVKGVTFATKQAAIDEACERVADKVKTNMATFHCSETGPVQSCGVFVRGRVCLLNKHSVDAAQFHNPDEVYVTMPNSAEIRKFLWKDLTIHTHPEMDLAAIGFPTQVRDHNDIVDSFCKESDVRYNQAAARIILKRRNSFETIFTQVKVKHQETLSVVTSGELGSDGLPKSEDCKYFDVKNYLYYTGTETKAGDCGSLVLHVNPRIAPKIMGMHVAGNPNIGYSFILVKEHVMFMLDKFPLKQKLIFVPPKVAVSQNYNENPIGGMTEYLGRVAPLYEPTKSSIRKSEIHGIFDVKKGPAILKPVNGHNPLLEGARKYGREVHYMTGDELQSCVDSVVAATFIGTEPMPARVLTTEEAIFGIPDIIEDLKTDTSPGYPWVTQNVKEAGKKHWIDTENKTIHADLLAAIEKLETNCANGIIDPCIFKDTLKDERRPLARINPLDPTKIKTRLVSAAPMELSIVMKKYFGAFVAFLEHNKIVNTMAIGVNPYGPDWAIIANHLHEVSTKISDGDFAGFDISQLPALVEVFFIVGSLWYEMRYMARVAELNKQGKSAAHLLPEKKQFEKDQLIRFALSRHVMFSVHINSGVIYRAMGKLPSGSWATTPINSTSGLSAFQYAFDKIFPEAPGPVNFHENVRFISQGDDNIFSTRATHTKFTCENIGAQLKNIGMEYTAATKGDHFEEARPIEECTFLKRGFKRIHGNWKAPLCLDTCQDMVMWTKKSEDNIAATIINCEVAARELAITEPTGESVKVIRAALMDKGINVPLADLRTVLADHEKFY